MTSIRSYLVGETLSSSELASWLCRQLEMTDDGLSKVSLRYLDTADWDLYRHNLVLEECIVEKDRRLRLMTLGERRLLSSLESKKRPRFSFEIVESLLGKRLAPIIGTAELLCMARMKGKIHCFHRRNEDGKTVLKLQLEMLNVVKSKTASISLTPRLQLTPVRGYQDYFDSAHMAIQKELGFTATKQDRLLSARTSTIVNLADEDMRSDAESAAESIHAKLLEWLETAKANVAGIYADSDPEHLHDFRVSIRRTRAALKHLRKAFPPARIKPLAREFADLAQNSSPLRDFDVMIANLKQQQHELPDEHRSEMTPIFRLLRAERTEARRRLLNWLSSQRYGQLIEQWEEMLVGGELKSALAPGSPHPLEQIAAEGISELFHLTLAQGKSISPTTESTLLHELRKTLKKLRYTLELFEPLYKKGKIKKILKSLKGLQEGLGELQDADVQMESLRWVRAQIDHKTHPGSITAIDALIELRREQEQQARRELGQAFEAFTTLEGRRRIASLCATTKHGSTS